VQDRFKTPKRPRAINQRRWRCGGLAARAQRNLLGSSYFERFEGGIYFEMPPGSLSP